MKQDYYVDNLEFNGIEGKTKARVITRGGSKSPMTILIYYKGRWITEYEQKKKKISLTRGSWLKIIYTPKISEVVYKENPFLNLVKSVADGIYHQPVILGNE